MRNWQWSWHTTMLTEVSNSVMMKNWMSEVSKGELLEKWLYS